MEPPAGRTPVEVTTALPTLRYETVQPAGNVIEPKVKSVLALRLNVSATALRFVTNRVNVVVVPGLAVFTTTGETSGPGPAPPAPPLLKSTVPPTTLTSKSRALAVALGVLRPVAVFWAAKLT